MAFKKSILFSICKHAVDDVEIYEAIDMGINNFFILKCTLLTFGFFFIL